MGEVIQDLSHEPANSKERSSRKLHLAGNDIVGSFRKSKEKLIGSRSPRKGGKGAAPVAAISAGVAPKAPAVSGEREQTEISLSGRSSGDLDDKTDQATSLETTPFTESEADEEPLPSLAIPAAILAVGPTAATAHLPAEEGAASSGKPLLGGGSPSAEPATHAATFELGEGASPGRRLSGLSTAHVPVVEWSSLVGHRFLGSGESQYPLARALPLRPSPIPPPFAPPVHHTRPTSPTPRSLPSRDNTAPRRAPCCAQASSAP